MFKGGEEMKRKKNISLMILGVVSLLFIGTLMMFSQSNTTEPVSASADSSQNETTIQSNSIGENFTNNENSKINNSVNNIINSASEETIINNNITNQIEAGNSDVDNSVANNIDSNGENTQITSTLDNIINALDAEVDNTTENNVNTGENNYIDNSVTNHIDVSIGVNVTNQIMNDVRATNNGENIDESNDGSNGSSENGNGSEETPETVWGVDSASLTTEDLLACVRENLGDPEVWGRYLGTNKGVSYGLTEDEIDLLHSNEINILVIWNHFTDGTGYENGQNEATEAVETARELGIPEGVALFANVEPIYPIDSEFIQGWHAVVSESEYNSGIYGIFDPSEELYAAFEAAAEEDSSIMDTMFVWTAAPNEGITTEENAPEYNPDYPEGALIGGWQYGIDAETCHIDTNIFDGNILKVLW
jgi:hypothetical protein